MFDHPLTRRSVLSGMVIGMSALVLPKLLWAGDAGHGTAPAISADQALQLLKDGNTRFLAGKSEHPNLTPQRIADTSANGQHPFVTIISCSDSRVPVEHLFDRGIGDLFVIRVAGNVADTDEIGTAEYGTGHLFTPLILVLGHTKCGAVTAVVKGDKVGGSIPKLVDNIIPAAQRSKDKGLTGDALIVDAIRENVYQSITDLLSHSEELSHLEHEGKVKVVGAVYHIEDGTVEWLNPESRPVAHSSTASVASDAIAGEIKQTVQAWAQAWASRNVGKYLEFYSVEDFFTEKFSNRAAWERNRVKMLKDVGAIRVALTDIQVAVLDPRNARSTFTQEYRSKNYQDKTRKTLILQKEDGAWKITRESD